MMADAAAVQARPSGQVAATEAVLRRAMDNPSDFRVLERLVVPTGPTGEGDPATTTVAVVVDVETMGLGDGDAVIELAVRRIRFDGAGIVTHVDRPYSWLEDPGSPLTPEVARITGLVDADLVGRRIDRAAASRILRSADVVVAHHAKFDRPRMERLVPSVAGRPWACSMAEVDWVAHGFDSVRLGSLLNAVGRWHVGHRAGADVDAVIALLRHRFDDGGTALRVLMDRASQPGWVVEAVGAHFDVKDLLRARGYRWDPGRKVWAREIYGEERDPEDGWLAAHVYSVEARARAGGPRWTAMDWTRRHG